MKNRNTLLVILFLLVLPLSAAAQSVSGQVRDSVTLKGLSYVVVQVTGTDKGQPYTSLSDPEGNYLISGLTEGTYILSASCLGYHSKSQRINIKQGEPMQVHLSLSQAMIPLGEVQVSSLRYEKLEREVAMPLSVVPRENFPRQSAVTLSDVLAGEPGISLVRDGGWGTSVNIRGLGESRLVTLVDGNRIETANDLVAGLSLFDVNEIERVEVIKGAASSIFGTGAMGGVVNIMTRKGNYYNKPTIHGSASGVYENVNQLLGTHLEVESGAPRWKVRLAGGYRDAGNYRTPEGIMENSQFSDRNLNATIGIKPLKNHELEVNAQHYQAFNVGIPGGAPFGPAATATYPEERRQLVSARYTVRNLLPAMNEMSVRFYHQYILRDVDMVPNTPPSVSGNQRLTALRVLPRGQHYTTGMVLETRWKTGKNSQLAGGLDFWERRLKTSREKWIRQEILDPFQNVLKTLEVVRTERPNPDSRFGSGGLFIQHEHTLLDGKLDLTYGARADIIRVENEIGLDPVGIRVDGIDKDPVPNQRITFNADTTHTLSWSANVSGLYHLTPNFDLTANVGRSFRSPSLEERFKYIDLGSKVRLGDPTLKPEKGVFGDLGIRIWKDRFQLQANGFIQALDDMIIEQPGEFIYTLATGNSAGITDTLPALINTNIDKALLAGFDASVNWQALRNLVVSGKSAYVRGFNTRQGTDLPLIPPMSAGGGIRYQLPGILTIEWTTTRVFAQNRVAAGEKPTEGYWLTDVAVYSFQKQLGIATFQVFAGVDNLFNASYRNHLATNRGLIVAEPGRNVFVKLLMRF